MDPYSFQSSISKFFGTTVILLGVFLVSLNPQNVAGKSIINTELDQTYGDGGSEELSPAIITLGMSGLPENIWNVKSVDSPRKFILAKNSSDFKIAIHLKECNFNGYIEVSTKDGTKENWDCNQKSNIRNSYFDEKQTGSASSNMRQHSGDKFVSALEVLDNLDEVLVTPKFESQHHSGQPDTDLKKKATIIVNIYKDLEGSGSCNTTEFFDCHQPLCVTKCCSDQHRGTNEGRGSSGGGSHIIQRGISLNFWSQKGHEKSRCIPKRLMCNDNPNCGMKMNIDETNQICRAEAHCPACLTVCLTWNYVLTSLAIAILFIITPTAIVFALFHRRNVALERARLLRLAQTRMTDLRGEFTRDAPFNDHPPTYDDVYDIKVPPPCFCQAIAMEMGVDALHLENSQSSCGRNCVNNSGSDGTNSNNSENNDSNSQSQLGTQNLAFKCSCQNLNQIATSNRELPLHILNINDSTTSSNNEERRNRRNTELTNDEEDK